MKNLEITKKLAVKLSLNAQLLDGQSKLSTGKDGVLELFDKLGYIQIDTISAINRSHHHTLWTRLPDYSENMLHDLQSKHRRIFEYWGHAMSYMPMSDYRYSLPRMANFLNPSHIWFKAHLKKCESLLQPVLKRIREEGPLSSKDFTASDKKSGAWWDWKPAKTALELLFWRGELMISERRNFRKMYDLTERVLPENINTTMPENDELGQFFVRRALLGLGIASKKQIAKFMQPDASRDSDLLAAGSEILFKSLDDLIETKEVIPVVIEKNEKTIYYAFDEIINKSSQLKPESSRVYLLSPFDNLIIQRERTKALFEFYYTLECYVPEAKRKYGYFVLPILWGGNFVGRLDPKADRKKKTLIIKSLIFEPQFKNFDKFFPVFAKKITSFAKFNDCEKIEINNVNPGKLKSVLEGYIQNNS